MNELAGFGWQWAVILNRLETADYRLRTEKFELKINL